MGAGAKARRSAAFTVWVKLWPDARISSWTRRATSGSSVIVVRIALGCYRSAHHDAMEMDAWMAIRLKTFSFHWGSGIIAEEAQFQGEWHRPTIQLLKYTEGEAAGGSSIRFCSYNHSGRFSRSPLMLSTEEIDGLRDALDKTPELRALLRRLVSPDE